MKLTDKQAHMLYMIALESLRLGGNVFSIPADVREKLVNEILNQQGNALKERSEGS